jgi:hypothetical protein
MDSRYSCFAVKLMSYTIPLRLFRGAQEIVRFKRVAKVLLGVTAGNR